MKGRPQDGEAPEYYRSYIRQAQGEDVLALLEAQREEFRRLFAGISEEKSLHRYAPEKWSIRQVVNHINDCERLFSFRAFWFARGCEAPLPSFEQNAAAAGAVADQAPWAAHVEEFARVRLATISLFRNLPEAAWQQSGVASENRFTVRALAFIAAGHAAHHARILREKYF